MIDEKADLSVKSQCRVLEIPRSTAYHKPKPVSDEGSLKPLTLNCLIYGSQKRMSYIRNVFRSDGDKSAI